MTAEYLLNLSEKMDINLIGTKIVVSRDEYIDFCGGDCEIIGLPSPKERDDSIAFMAMDEHGVEVGILLKSEIKIAV